MLALANTIGDWRACPRCHREQVGHRVLAYLKHYLHRAKAVIRENCKADFGHQLTAFFCLSLSAFGAIGICLEGRPDHAIAFALPLGPLCVFIKWSKQ